MIPIEIKKQCVERKSKGEPVRDTYKFFKASCDSTMNMESFRRKLNQWKKHSVISDDILFGASLSGNMKPTHGTVQVDENGKVTRAWIRGDSNEYWQEQILEAISKVQPLPTVVERYEAIRFKSLLEIPLFDMHFGVADLEYYLDVQREVIEHIERGHEKIVFAIGSDLFHNNDHRGRTAKGTFIEGVDMCKAYDDALKFYIPLIESALSCSVDVEIVYIKGNHDESPSYFFCRHLKSLFPTVKFNLDFQEKKIVTWEEVFIGYTHGDKGKSAIPMVFIAKYPMEWAKSKVKEIHTGHLHVESVKDSYGAKIRILPTANITDQWSEDNAYEMAAKEFQLFEYRPDRLKSVHTVKSK